MAENSDRLRELVAEVAAAYFSNSHVGPNDIPHVVKQIADSLTSVGGEAAAAPNTERQAAPEAAPEPTKLTPAQIRKSITPDAIISFEDNKPYKALKRHLTIRGLTPAQYREKWGLPKDYPMVAASYSERRAKLARDIGLGANRRKGAAPAAAEAAPQAKVAKTRTAKPKAAKPATQKARRGGGRKSKSA